MKPRLLLLGTLFAALGAAFSPAHAASTDDNPPFKESEFRPATLGPREPGLQVDFPTAATARGIGHGRAVVNVMIDSDGQPLDFIITSQTDPAFGKALLEKLQTTKFQAAQLRGVPIPARCGFAYDFENRGTTSMNSFEASSLRSPTLKSKPVYEAVAEGKLDKKLEIINGMVPTLPPNAGVSADKPIKVLVSFFIDETGQVRAPQVESAPSPHLIAPVVAALSSWSFKPPTVGGKPALVLVARPIPVAPAKAN